MDGWRDARALLALSVLLASGCNTLHWEAIDPPVLTALSPNSFSINAGFFDKEYFGVSPTVEATQGYATDGENNFLLSTRSIVETDAQWTEKYSNTAPFAGLSGIKVTHLGDGEVSGNKIYVPLLCKAGWSGCGQHDTYALGIYAAHTAGLPLLQWADITASGCDASSVAVGPENTLYVASFWIHPGRVCLFDATTLASKGFLTLSVALTSIQGISYNAAAQQFAVSVDNEGETTGYIYFVSLSGQVTGPVYSLPNQGELEGLDYTQGYIGYDINARIDYLFPVQATGSSFKAISVATANGVDQQTTVEGSNALWSMIAASSLKSFGEVRVQVVNPGGLRGGSSSVLDVSVTGTGQ